MYNELLTTETVTHHNVDDAVPCHEAFESFRRHFPKSHGALSEDRRAIVYPDADGIIAACEVIDYLQLPLYAIILDGQLMICFGVGIHMQPHMPGTDPYDKSRIRPSKHISWGWGGLDYL